MNSKGSCLIECVIASLIFLIAMSAIFATIKGTRKTVTENARQAIAALYTKSVLEDLRTKVDARAWHNEDYDNLLSVGPHEISKVFEGIEYKGNYTVSIEPISKARKIVVNLAFATE